MPNAIGVDGRRDGLEILRQDDLAHQRLAIAIAEQQLQSGESHRMVSGVMKICRKAQSLRVGGACQLALVQHDALQGAWR